MKTIRPKEEDMAQSFLKPEISPMGLTLVGRQWKEQKQFAREIY